MYKINLKMTMGVFIVLGLTSCSLKQAPLMYSSKTTLGIDLSTAVAETGATFNFGFKNHDMIYIPAVVSSREKNATNTDLNSSLMQVQSQDNDKNDTLSIYATFNSNFSSSQSSDKNIGLGSGVNKFVSTGIAAQNLANNISINQCISYAKEQNATDIIEILKQCNALLGGK